MENNILLGTDLYMSNHDMKTVLFSKGFKSKSPEELVGIAKECGVDGYDLCIRRGHQVTPDNVSSELKKLAGILHANGLEIPMVSGEGSLLYPDDPTAMPILKAMADSGIRFLKLGYFVFDSKKNDYTVEVNKVRRVFDGWQKLCREFDVKICYHTHCGSCMGLNGAALAVLLKDFDPSRIGAYIDPAHLVVNGEDFDFALAMLKDHLALVALKDVLLTREEKGGHGTVKIHWVEAGHGMVDWSAVFAELRRIKYDGIFSVHCEFEVPEEEFMRIVVKEVRFFRKFVGSPA